MDWRVAILSKTCCCRAVVATSLVSASPAIEGAGAVETSNLGREVVRWRALEGSRSKKKLVIPYGLN
jgi:hypothetical protein